MTCALTKPSRRLGAVRWASSISERAIPIRNVPPGAVRSVQGTSTILFVPTCAETTTPT